MPADDRSFEVFDPSAPLPTGRLLIEASAGTGKTYTISTLAVRFVAEVEGVGAAGLCVVSFTEAATAELRSRIRQRMVDVADALESDAQPTDDLAVAYRALPADQQALIAARLRRATEEFDRAIITTIHGFCSRVLAALGAPVGAVGPGGEEVAEVVNDLLLTSARPLAGRPSGDGAAGQVASGGSPEVPVAAAGSTASGKASTSGQASGKASGRASGKVSTLDPVRFRKAVETLVQLPLATMDGADGTSTAATAQPVNDDELRHRIAEVAIEARRLVGERRRAGAVRSFDSLLTDVRDLLDPAAGATDASRSAVRNALASVRVVMVDEFQDTDGLQWAIFDNAFPAGTCPMVLVGDPKQSIYRFRSAELSAYLAARSSADMSVATLGTNYRSDPGVLDGLQRLYAPSASGETYALGSDVNGTAAVHFRPVTAHHRGRRLVGMDVSQSVELRILDPSAGAQEELSDGNADGDQDASPGKPLPTGLRRAWVADDVARQVSRLLRAADPDDPTGRMRSAVRIVDGEAGGERDLRPSDIAVLVGSNADALTIAHRLGRSGIAAATATTNSVLDGAAAWQWRLLLAALVRPAAPGPARAAALGWFLGVPAAALADPEADLAFVHEQLARWASVLRRGGPIALLAEARRAGLADRLLARLGGERRITDLEHIAELLQASVGARPPGALDVLEALEELSGGADTDAAVEQMARRIDRDDDAVQVFTIHRAKGLEFPIVLCPYLWPTQTMRGVPHAAVPGSPVDEESIAGEPVDGAPADDGGADCGTVAVERRVWTPWTYRASNTAKGALGDFLLPADVTRGGEKATSRFKLEHLEEADRLTYVALTRAAAHLVVWWSSPASASGSGGRDQALTRLLSHATGLSTSDLVAEPAKARAVADGAIRADLVDIGEPEQRRVVTSGVEDLDRAVYTRSAHQPWRRWSYSRLSEELVGGVSLGDDAPGGPGVPVADADDDHIGGADERPVAGVALPEDATDGAGADPVVAEGAPAGAGATGDTSAVGEQPANPFAGLGGTRFGTMVHAVLEAVDFTSGDLVGDLNVLLADAMAHWKTADRAPTVAAGLAAALEVPLEGPLRAVDTRLVALPPDHRLNELRFDLALGPTTVRDIAEVLADDPVVADPFGGWLDRLRGGPVVEGMLTGSIDLVASFDGEQYWVADHKTNLLSGGYGPEQLVAGMAHHDYPLQATLYLVALHRFLTQRLADYDPDRHLAGAAYLFVRGMAADGSGIYWFTPAASTVRTVSELLAQGAAR